MLGRMTSYFSKQVHHGPGLKQNTIPLQWIKLQQSRLCCTDCSTFWLPFPSTLEWPHYKIIYMLNYILHFLHNYILAGKASLFYSPAGMFWKFTENAQLASGGPTQCPFLPSLLCLEVAKGRGERRRTSSTGIPDNSEEHGSEACRGTLLLFYSLSATGTFYSWFLKTGSVHFLRFF